MDNRNMSWLHCQREVRKGEKEKRGGSFPDNEYQEFTVTAEVKRHEDEGPQGGDTISVQKSRSSVERVKCEKKVKMCEEKSLG